MCESLKLSILNSIEEGTRLMHKIDNEDVETKNKINDILAKLEECLMIVVNIEHLISLAAMQETDTK